MLGGHVIQAQQYHAAANGPMQSSSKQNHNMQGITVIKENNIVMNGPTNMMGRRIADQNQNFSNSGQGNFQNANFTNSSEG